jgi:hypothetical protein
LIYFEQMFPSAAVSFLLSRLPIVRRVGLGPTKVCP